MTRVARARWEDHFARGRGFRGVRERELRLLGEAVRPRAGARALDVGCGLGTYAAALAGLGYDTLAVDWADAAVAATRDRYADLEPRLRVRGLLAPGGAWVVTTPLADRLPLERRYIGVTPEDVAVVTEGWGRGEWYDLDGGGLRCFVLRA